MERCSAESGERFLARKGSLVPVLALERGRPSDEDRFGQGVAAVLGHPNLLTNAPWNLDCTINDALGYIRLSSPHTSPVGNENE